MIALVKAEAALPEKENAADQYCQLLWRNNR